VRSTPSRSGCDGQNEIGTKFNSLVKRADWMQILKYTVWNVAHSYGKTATFMPKPVVGDNGSACTSTSRCGKTKRLVSGQRLLGAVDFRPILHRRHHQARKGLERHYQSGDQFVQASGAGVRGADQPRLLVAQPLRACRIPLVTNPRRAEWKCASPTRRPSSLSRFCAMLMAGLDGVQNKIHPGDPIDKNMYDLPPAQAKKIQQVCSSLEMALECLNKDRDFLTKGGVFSDDMLDAYCGLKHEELTPLSHDDPPGRIRHVLQLVKKPKPRTRWLRVGNLIHEKGDAHPTSGVRPFFI